MIFQYISSYIFCILISQIESLPQENSQRSSISKNSPSNNGKWYPPSIEIYELRTSKVGNRWNETLLAKVNTDKDQTQIAQLDVEGLKLYCEADYPIHWTYEGLGDFSFLSTSSGSYSRSGSNGDYNEFYETVYLNPLTGAYTAKYVCYGQNFHNRRSSVFIYVPGNNLFVSTRGRNIYFSGDKGRTEDIIIPCAVSHPDVKVSLAKANEDSSEIVNVNNKAIFEPQHGFQLKLNEISQPVGKYICTARMGKLFKVVQYNVVRDNGSLKRCARSCPENSHCETGRRGFQSEYCRCDTSFKALDAQYFMCFRSCKSDSDCPSTMSCQSREKQSTTQSYFWNSIATTSELREYASICQNPCIYNLSELSCGGKSSCRVDNHVAKCHTGLIA